MNRLVTVLTGDVVQSSTLPPERRSRLQRVLKEAVEAATRMVPGFQAEPFRGDAFQGILPTRPEMGLRLLLFIHAWLRRDNFGIRIALGAGAVLFESDRVLTSDGPAFQLSGPALDDLKKRHQLVAVLSTSEDFNREWRVHSLTLDYVLARLTGLQAEALIPRLQGFTQESTARRLQVSQPAVQQRLRASAWTVLEAIVERFEQVVPTL